MVLNTAVLYWVFRGSGVFSTNSTECPNFQARFNSVCKNKHAHPSQQYTSLLCPLIIKVHVYQRTVFKTNFFKRYCQYLSDLYMYFIHVCTWNRVVEGGHEQWESKKSILPHCAAQPELTGDINGQFFWVNYSWGWSWKPWTCINQSQLKGIPNEPGLCLTGSLLVQLYARQQGLWVKSRVSKGKVRSRGKNFLEWVYPEIQKCSTHSSALCLAVYTWCPGIWIRNIIFWGSSGTLKRYSMI